MDVLLWILIGLAAGLAITALMPESAPRTRRRSGERVIRGMAAGAVGAAVIPWVYVRLDSSVTGDNLTIGLLALAGGLWLAMLIEMYSARRRHGEGAVVPVTVADRVGAMEMQAYDATREALVAGLMEDALAHDAGRYAEIGRGFPAVRDRVSRQDLPWNSRLQLALRFWRGWTQARDARWRPGEASEPVAAADWPRYARTIATDLALDRDTVDPAIVGRFAYVIP